MNTTPDNPTIPAGSAVPTWLPSCPKYVPTKIERDCVEELQSHGGSKIVYYVLRDEGQTTSPRDDQHEIYFVSTDWMRESHGSSESIVKNPELAYYEQGKAGVLNFQTVKPS